MQTIWLLSQEAIGGDNASLSELHSKAQTDDAAKEQLYLVVRAVCEENKYLGQHLKKEHQQDFCYDVYNKFVNAYCDPGKNINGYLYTIVRNTLLNRLRLDKRTITGLSMEGMETCSFESFLFDQLTGSEWQALIGKNLIGQVKKESFIYHNLYSLKAALYGTKAAMLPTQKMAELVNRIPASTQPSDLRTAYSSYDITHDLWSCHDLL